MFLKKLELNGFKSFAEKTVLEFPKFDQGNPSITAVVGPNGSGKSNLTDAIRWALGEQSYKSLRTKKSEDIVFAGTAKKSRGSFSEVSLNLDNSDSKMPIDFKDIMITRRLYRNGDNEYLVNKSKARLLDIEDLLAKAGFGQATYTVIGQGMIDAMLFYGPEERKVLFDEAAGVRQYELKKEQAARKLVGTEQNLVSVRNILSELSPRLTLLRRQAKRAKEREETEQELRKLQSDYFSFLWYSLSQKIEEILKHKSEAEKEVLKIKDEVKKIQKILEEEEGKEESKFKEIDDLRNLVEELTRKRDSLKENLIVKLGKLEVQKSQILSSGNISFKEEESKLSELNKKIVQYREKIDLKEQEIEKLKKELHLIVQSINKEENDLSFLSIHKQIEPILFRQKDLVLKLEFAKNLNEIKDISEEARIIFEDLGRIQDQLKSASGESRNKKLEEKRLLESKLKTLELEVAKAKATAGVLKEQANDLEKRVAGLKENVKEQVGFSKESLEEETALLKKKVGDVEKELDLNREKLRELEIKDRSKGKEILDSRDEVRKKQELLSQYSRELTNHEIELAKFETKRDDLEQEIKRDLGDDFIKELRDKKIPFNSLSQENLRELEGLVEKQKQRVFAAGAIDPEVIEEFNQCETRNNFLSSQLVDLEKAKSDLSRVIEELDGQIKDQFYSAFNKISEEFSKFFSILFGGGKAALMLKQTEVSSPDDLSEEDEIKDGKICREGIEIQVSPPGKRISNLSVLSGGERALTSIALLCAILTINPSPFCVLDEVDAALDESNTQRFLSILKELAKKTQFIIITHNRETMKEASVLYGVTMGEDHVSRLLSMKLEEAEVVAETG